MAARLKDNDALTVIRFFPAPVLWAISVHLDKYLLDRFFQQSDVAVLLVVIAFIGVVMLPFIRFYNPGVFSIAAKSIAIIATCGRCRC